MQEIKTRLDYVSGRTLLPEGAFGISPSNVNKFFDKPHEWYREQVLGEDGFDGNTSSTLGTIVHFCGEEFATKQTVDHEEIEKYLAKEAAKPDVDGHYIESQWKVMGQALIDYLRENGIPDRVEELVKWEVIPGYFASGSADAVHGTTLIDYKTTSNMTAPDKIPYYYKYQLLTYAYIYNQLGITIDRIRIVWITHNQTGRFSEKTGKPLKDYPTTVTAVTEMITQEDLDFIESLLKLVAESVDTVKQNPDLAYLVFKDYRLKGK